MPKQGAAMGILPRSTFAPLALSAPEQGICMPPRLKKLIGTVLLVALVVIYALAATTIASYRLANASIWAHLAFFAIGGVLWIAPAMWLIAWMERKPKPKS
jgi:uncharacterized membrane protein